MIYTAFCGGVKQIFFRCLKYELHVFFDKIYKMQYREGSGTPVLFVECTMDIDGRKGKDIPLMCRKKLLLSAFTLGFKGLMTKVNP